MGVGRPTEMTIGDLLQEELLDELYPLLVDEIERLRIFMTSKELL